MVQRMVWLLVMLLMATPAIADEVERGAWQEHMLQELPQAFCGDGTYFRECFRVSQDHCVRAARASTRECLEEHAGEIPERLALPGQGREFGSLIGRCAGRTYEEALSSERRLTRTCRNPDAWQ